MKKWLVVCIVVLLAAFCAVASAELTVPESVTEIQEEAFANCESAEVLTILSPDARIADNALEGSSISLIRCWKAAEAVIAFAGEHDIPVEYLDGDPITVWTSLPELTTRQIQAFKAANPKYSGWDFDVVEVSESEIVSELVEREVLPDVFGFAQDQLASLYRAGWLDLVPGAASIRARNAAGAVSAAETAGKLVAYPMTADNGFFLYYDSSVINDPSSLEKILADCEAAGKKFYMQVDSGWYQVAFFFGAGCELEFKMSPDGESFNSVNIQYANANGLAALKGLIRTIGSPAFVNGSSVDSAENWAAIVSGTWDAMAARNSLGQNFAAAKLPTIDGYQMKSYGGFKLLGVAPQGNSGRRAVCHALADWLTNEACQLQRFEERGWGPSNLAAQQNEMVRGDEALTALADQAQYAVPQGQIHGGYWDLAKALIDEIISGQLDDADDEELMDRLVRFEEDIRALVVPSPNVGISMPTDFLWRWDHDGNAIRSGLEADGYVVDLQFAENNPDKQAQQILSMIEEDVDVLIIAPVTSSTLMGPLQLAADMGITVIAYDRLLQDTAAVDYYITFDNWQVGVVQGSYIRDRLDLDHASGPFFLEITAGDAGDPTGELFYRGAMSVLQPYIDDGILVVKSGQTAFEDVATSGWRTENARARAEEILSAYYADGSRLDAWLCINDSTAIGVIQALESGYTGAWPVITGQDCDIENVRKIIAGKQSMSVFKDTGTEAARAVTMAEEALQRKTVTVNDTESYNNGVKTVPAFACMPVYVDVNNYEELLIDSGIYNPDWF